jgi:cytidylate kinase
MKMADAEGFARSPKTGEAAASEGNCVIVGRGSAYYLHDRPDCLSRFVYAPFEEKVRRLLAKGKSEEEAMQLARNRRPATARPSSSSTSESNGLPGILST